METLAQELDPTGDRVLVLQCDVTDEGSVIRAVNQTLERFDRIDVVIANAGIGVLGEVEKVSMDDYRRQFETNVYGVLNTVRATLQSLKTSKGCLALVGSITGYGFYPFASPYVISKHAVRGLAESLHLEFSHHGISVTHIVPGAVESEIRGEKDSVPRWLVVPTLIAARKIVRAILDRQRELVFPRHAKLYVFLERHAPWLSENVISLKRRLGRAGR
jgi:NAD(P)-dependent dehydrogenase (short-subunit alcohol dehydrogenase family)